VRDGVQAMRAAPDQRTLANLSYHVRGELQRQLSGFKEELNSVDVTVTAEILVRGMVLLAFRTPPSSSSSL
jgi:hypothetical protein